MISRGAAPSNVWLIISHICGENAMLRGAPREVISKPEIKEKAFLYAELSITQWLSKIEHFTPQMKTISLLLTVCPSIHPSFIHPWIYGSRWETWSLHWVLGWALALLPVGCTWYTFQGRRLGAILTRCPNHLSGSTTSSPWMTELLCLSLRLTLATLCWKLVRLYPQSRSFGQYPQLRTRTGSVDRLTQWGHTGQLLQIQRVYYT